ncbi:MAG: ester cyclase [Gaiellaceae bacterium]
MGAFFLAVLAGMGVGMLALRRTRRTEGGAPVVSANKEIIRRVVDGVWMDRNFAVVDELIAQDYVGHDPTQPEQIRGRDGFKQFVGMYQAAFHDATVTIDDQIAEGDRVVTRWTGRGTHTGELMGIAPTGKEITVSGITVSRLAGGKIAEEWELMDALGMLVQLGAVPQPATA